MGTGGSFLGGGSAGAWGVLGYSNLCRGQENMGLYIHSPIMSSWRSADLVKHTDNFYLYRSKKRENVATRIIQKPVCQIFIMETIQN
jgi:hypothetical protein